MNWLILIIAGFVEVAWAVALKYSEGFHKFWPSTISVICMILSVCLLSLALKNLPVGTAYAVWTGVGAVGTALLGIFLFHESWHWLRLVCIGLIVAGIIGLRIMAPMR